MQGFTAQDSALAQGITPVIDGALESNVTEPINASQAGRQAGRLNEASAMVLLRTHVALRAC